MSLLGISFLRGVLEDVVGEIGEGERRGAFWDRFCHLFLGFGGS